MTDGESVASPTDEVHTQQLDVTSHGCEGGPAVEESLPRDSVGSAPRVSCEDSSGNRPRMPGESEGTRVANFTVASSVPEDENPGDMDLVCPVVFPEDDEWKTLPRPQSPIPEYSFSGSPTPVGVRSGNRESPFQKWGSPPRANDSDEFHSGEDPDAVGHQHSEPTPETQEDLEILLQTIEE